MIKTVKLAGYEFRRFKGPWSVVGLLFVLLIPTVFAGLYLWSNEDPYGKRDQVPVAVVNLDEPAQVENTTVSAGDRLVRELGADPIFAWNFVDQDQAEQGLADGTYYMIVEIPPDFSANLISGSGDAPQRANVNLRLNDATGYLTELLVASAQPRLEAAINRAAIGVYLESVFANLDTIRTAVRAAADSAGKMAADLAAGLTQATDLSTAVSTAKQSSTTVVRDLATAKSSSAALVTSSGTPRRVPRPRSPHWAARRPPRRRCRRPRTAPPPAPVPGQQRRAVDRGDRRGGAGAQSAANVERRPRTPRTWSLSRWDRA